MSMTDFIEIFYSARDHTTPYHAIIWRDGVLVDIMKFERLAPLTIYWMQDRLPVLCTDEQIRKQLRLCGIPAKTPLPRRKGEDATAFGSVHVIDTGRLMAEEVEGIEEIEEEEEA
jgi:hypothetical protein